jgi:hypothetical protein
VGQGPSSGGVWRAIVYVQQSDHLYTSSGGGLIRRMPSASLRDWAAVVSADWQALPDLGGNMSIRSLALDGEGGGIGLLER